MTAFETSYLTRRYTDASWQSRSTTPSTLAGTAVSLNSDSHWYICESFRSHSPQQDSAELAVHASRAAQQRYTCALEGLRRNHWSQQNPAFNGWVRCSMQMNKERICRHVMETHLQVKHICPFCDEVFSRKLTLHTHVRSRSPTGLCRVGCLCRSSCTTALHMLLGRWRNVL